jgi:hypothetical protein
MVADPRHRPLETSPCPFHWLDAPARKFREGGRTANVRTLIAPGVNEDMAGVLAWADEPRPVSSASNKTTENSTTGGDHLSG